VPRRCAALALILLLLGGNAAVVQMVGWAGMLAERAGRMGWNAAVESTFSGSERCAMCHAAAALRDEGDPGSPVPEATKQLDKLPSAPPHAQPCLDLSGSDGQPSRLPATACRPGEYRPAPQPPPPRAV